MDKSKNTPKQSVVRPGQLNYFYYRSHPLPPQYQSQPTVQTGQRPKFHLNTHSPLFYVCAAVLLIAFAAFQAHHSGSSSPSDSTTPVTIQHKSGFNDHQYSTSDPASPWVIVNKQHPLNPLQYAPSDLQNVGNGQYLRTEAANALTTMLTAAKAAGHIITPESGYRSYDKQELAYSSEVAAYGKAYADLDSARPGYSEHQTGWAIDLGSEDCAIQSCFAGTPDGKWVIANAYRFGFILRYPPNLIDVTGYHNEAWHFRYVGKTLSTEMHEERIATLEQFFGIAGGPNYL